MDREVTLVSADAEEFTVPTKLLSISKFLTGVLSEAGDEEHDPIPLPNVKGVDLANVVEFCRQYAVQPMVELQKPLENVDIKTLVQPWYSDFILSKPPHELYNLTAAANYLDIGPLLDLCCARIASFVKDKSPEEIRQNLNVEVDMTPEEEAQIRAENAWADDLRK